MENWIGYVLLAAGCGWLALQSVMGLLLLKLLQEWTAVRRSMKSSGETPVETEEEKELRRVSAEAQRYYEQGFVNLMSYDGSPGRKEREMR